MTDQVKITAKVEAAQQQEAMSQIISQHSTTSARIRALDAAGYSRGAIALALGKRYQHVRNVLVTQLSTKS